jgi:hypothetical protein
MPVLELNSVRDTTLWNLLNESFSGAEERVAKALAADLVDICHQAYERMKNFPSLHPEYTLHDAVHCLRVTELMYRVMPESVIGRLNPVEIALLILSAHFHDQGMVLEKGEIEELRSSPKFKVFEDDWEIEHPNIKEVRQRLGDRNITGSEQERIREAYHELRAALLTDYVRITHGERSARLVRSEYSEDRRWFISETNIADLVARLCASHVRSATELIPPKGFRHDEVVGAYKVNMPYIGLVLRLADILDFDRDRTPTSLYRTIDFRSRVSLREWEKHRSVTGWIIEPTLIQFTMQCEHPEYQRAAYQFMDWIDKELTDAHQMIRSFPSQFSDYKLELPLAVDRSRIEPKDQAYIYYDLEFSLSRDEVVKLLMTDKLYGSPKLSIRELLQNALDALRHRKALIKRDNGTDWELGKVVVEHVLDEHEHEAIRCTDNGVGMDRSIIARFLTKAGRSYYRSPEFEQERVSFREHGVDFDPCAQFGIGFMSCFMLGDRIKILTRRDNGPSRGLGEPLLVEINGLGGMIVIRKGDDEQPVGTTVEITGRKKPRGFEEWQDHVQLIDMLNGYAIATEFPIEAHCTLPEIAGSVSIPAQIAIQRTSLEKSDIKGQVTLVQEFSEIHPLLGGSLRLSLLVDDSGLYTLKNSEAHWKPSGEGRFDERAPSLRDSQDNEIDKYALMRENQICLDGILVAGDPGRQGKPILFNVTHYPSPIGLGRARFVLDIRGQIKPPLTPARNPPQSARDFLRSEPRWSYIQSLASQAKGRLLERIAQQLTTGLEGETFWQLALINDGYGSGIHWMRAGAIWSLVSVPVLDEDGNVEWRKISALGTLGATAIKQEGKTETFQLISSDGKRLGSYDGLSQWLVKQYEDNLHWDLNSLVACMSTVIIKDGQALLDIRHPLEPETSPRLRVLSEVLSDSVYALPYGDGASQFFSVHMAAPLRTANRNHPLVNEALSVRYLEQKSELQEFAAAAVLCLSAPETAAILTGANPKIGRWQRRVGYLYENVDWQSVAAEMRPPYKIRTTDGDSIEAAAEDFVRWANAEVNPKE